MVQQAQQKFTRNKNLIKDKAISQEVYQDSQTDLNVAKAKLTSLDAQIEKAQSSLDGDKTNLSYTKNICTNGWNDCFAICEARPNH